MRRFTRLEWLNSLHGTELSSQKRVPRQPDEAKRSMSPTHPGRSSSASDTARCAAPEAARRVLAGTGGQSYRAKSLIAIAQVIPAIGKGVCFSRLTFDEEYSSVPRCWFELDRLGHRGIGEGPAGFLIWPRRPHCQSTQAAHAPKRVDYVCR